MWILASSQGTSFPFIQIMSDFGKDMFGRGSSWRADSAAPEAV